MAGSGAPPPALAQGLVGAAGSLVAHDVNRVFLRISNRGGFGLSLQDNDAGNFPRGTLNRYLFGAGLWVGGVGDVDADGEPDTLTTIGYNPSNIDEIEWIEGAVGFNRNDARFRVLDAGDPADIPLFPATPVADQELFTIYGDRFSVVTDRIPSIPLGIEVRQRSFAFIDPELATAVILQWDFLNISDRIRSTGYTIRDLWTGIVLDPDIQVSPIGDVNDDTAAPLEIDGEQVLLIWDSDFSEVGFEGRAGFLAIVPLVNPGGETTVTQLTSGTTPGVLLVPRTDATQYATLAGIPPRTPTIAAPGFDMRALIGWGAVDLAPGAVHRTAAAFVWADASGPPPDFLSPLDPDLDADLPLIAGLVEAVRAARAAYDERLSTLPALLDFPGEPAQPAPGDVDIVLQNYPNPFEQETTIEYRIAGAGDVELKVFDLAGRQIADLGSGPREPASFETVWDGRNGAGNEVPAGVYVIRLETARGTSSVRALKLP
ncbi:MAG TPA: FlgD immunoglobulin-like domain containing protein [Gemmatimonadota bacterium]|nr:FlgD immunoglobulin-like domain containing protein [Gemmatimonadota bacterium]